MTGGAAAPGVGVAALGLEAFLVRVDGHVLSADTGPGQGVLPRCDQWQLARCVRQRTWSYPGSSASQGAPRAPAVRGPRFPPTESSFCTYQERADLADRLRRAVTGGRLARPAGAPQASPVARRQACSVSGATRLMHRLDCSPQVPERRDGGAADVTRRRQLLQTTRGTGGSAIRSGHGRAVPARSVAISSRCATSIQQSSPAMPTAALPPCPGRQRNKARPPSSCLPSPRTPKASRASTSKIARKRNCYIRTTFTEESPTTRSTAPAPLACGRSR